MNKKTIQNAAKRMESLLSQLTKMPVESIGDQKIKEVRTIIPKDHPQIIGHGTMAIVISLGTLMTENTPMDIIGKVVHYKEKEEYYELYGSYCGSFAHSIEITANTLRSVGFKNVLEHHEIFRSYVREGPSPYMYHIAPDLRDHGQYDVFSLGEFPFEKVENASELEHEVHCGVEKILALIKRDILTFEGGHSSYSSEGKALEHMFLGRIKKNTRKGEVFLADLDHCTLYKKADFSTVVAQTIRQGISGSAIKK